MAKNLAGYLNFFWAGVAKQVQTGAIFPSQRYLIERMIAPIPAHYRGVIAELGAGTGALTIRLAARCPAAKILACEINPVLAKDLRHNLDRAGINGQVQVVPDAAENVLIGWAQKNRRGLDYIISGIPLGNASKRKTVALLECIDNTLSREGMYIQFQHSLLDRKNIQSLFPFVRTVPVLLNFPPAFVYYARKQARGRTHPVGYGVP
jgi:phospholipid N-methyltransferase